MGWILYVPWESWGGEEGGRGEGSQVGERKVLKGNKEAEAAEAGDPEPFCATIPAIKIRIGVCGTMVFVRIRRSIEGKNAAVWSNMISL